MQISARSRMALVLGLGMLILFAACAPAAEPTAAPAPMQPPAPTSTPIATPTPASRYPLTVTDMLGRAVQVPKSPSRIVTISPTSTEMLYGIGGAAIGRDTSSKYPPEAQPAQTVGGAYSPSVEGIIALQPDLILIEALTQGRLLDQLQKAGAPVVAVRATSLDDVAQSLTLLGKVTDREQQAAQVVSEIRAKVEAAKGQAAKPKKVVILISDADRNIYAAKPESYPGAVAALLRQENLAAGMPDGGPFPGFTLYSSEKALGSNPDVIFAISPAPPPAPRLSQSLSRIPGYAELAAVKNGKVYELSPDIFLSAPGPRIAQATEEMARLLATP